MHSRDQLKALKKKSRPKTRGRKKLVNRKFTEFVPTLVESGMLSGGPLATKQISKLKIYKGKEHPHVSQNPTKIEFSKLNSKNSIRIN